MHPPPEEWQRDAEFLQFIQKKFLSHIMMQPPSVYRELLSDLQMVRLQFYYTNHNWGVLSGCKDEKTKLQNLELQMGVYRKVVEEGYRPISHLGWWNRLPERCLFIPCIDRFNLRKLSENCGLPFYVWGSKSVWAVFSVNEDIVHEDNTLKVIGPDEEFEIFLRLARKKQRLKKELARFGQDWKSMDGNTRKQVQILKRDLIDLERLEGEMVGV